MTFPYSKPSWTEMEQLEVIEITHEIPWHPVLHSDDSHAIRTMNETSAFTTKQDPPAALAANLWTMNQSGTTKDSDGDTFHDASSFPTESYSSDSFMCSRNQDDEQSMFYFDPEDISIKGQYGRAFHLTINYDAFLTKREEPTVSVRESLVDELLMRIENDELLGKNESFDSYVYALRAVHRFREEDLALIQPYLGFRPLEVVRQTLLHTTQLAKAIIHAPLKKHFHSRFRYLNRLCIHETVSMDTLLANCKGVTGKSCAQVFYGITSHVMNVYGMKSKAEVPAIYKDFIREEGIPSILHRDGAKEQASEAMQDINREFIVKDSFPEPHSPWQNPVEARSIRWLKNTAQVLMDCQGAPDIVWLQAMQYMAEIHNNTANETLGWITPTKKRKGNTPDISAYLHFKFYERVYYLDSDSTFPSTKEKSGYWIGVSKNIGDALTYEILTDNKETVISRSVVRTAEERLKANLGVQFNHNLDPDVRLHTDTHHLDIPLETSLTHKKVKNRHKRRYGIKPKAIGTKEPMSSTPSDNDQEATPGSPSENVKTMTTGQQSSQKTVHPRTNKHKHQPVFPTHSGGAAHAGNNSDSGGTNQRIRDLWKDAPRSHVIPGSLEVAPHLTATLTTTDSGELNNLYKGEPPNTSTRDKDPYTTVTGETVPANWQAFPEVACARPRTHSEVSEDTSVDMPLLMPHTARPRTRSETAADLPPQLQECVANPWGGFNPYDAPDDNIPLATDDDANPSPTGATHCGHENQGNSGSTSSSTPSQETDRPLHAGHHNQRHGQ